MQVHLSSQFNRHLVETFDRIRYAVYRFETFTYDPVDRDPGKCELQIIRVPIPRGVPGQKEILTLAATTKASFHSPLANLAFTHSLNSGVGFHESKVA